MSDRYYCPYCGLVLRRDDGPRALGGDTDMVLAKVLGMSAAEIASLRESGALT